MTLIPCACGCGQYRHALDSRGHPRKYINGHNKNRTGIKHTEDTKSTMSAKQKGANNPRWIGGRWLTGEGYYRLWKPEHPQANSVGYVLEHRFLYEQYHNVCLLSWTVVHHKNGIKTDNRPENLEAMFPDAHNTLHWQTTRKRLIRVS